MNADYLLAYLSDLGQNNSRDCFLENKAAYREAGRLFEEMIGSLMQELRKTDDTLPLFEPKELVFQLRRDTRFSCDKSPYNPCFRAHISAGGKRPVPVGYYLSIRPGNRSFFGGRAVCGYVQGRYRHGAGLSREAWRGMAGDFVVACLCVYFHRGRYGVEADAERL